MAPILKHGGHRFVLSLPSLAAGAASDTSTLWAYDFSYGTYGVYDSVSETAIRGTVVLAAAVTGAATNNFAVQMTHYNVAGSVVDQVIYTFGNGTNATAYVPIDLTNQAAGTGNTFIKGWILVAGDTIELKRVTNGTGLSSPAMGVTIAIDSRNA